MIYSLFTGIIPFVQVFWVSSFYLSIDIVVLYQFMVYRNLKREVCRTEKRLKIVIVLGCRRCSREGSNGFVKADVK